MSKEQLKPTQEQPEVIQVRSEKKRGIHYPTKAEISAGFQSICDQYGLKPDDYLPEIAKITQRRLEIREKESPKDKTMNSYIKASIKPFEHYWTSICFEAKLDPKYPAWLARAVTGYPVHRLKLDLGMHFNNQFSKTQRYLWFINNAAWWLTAGDIPASIALEECDFRAIQRGQPPLYENWIRTTIPLVHDKDLPPEVGALTAKFVQNEVVSTIRNIHYHWGFALGMIPDLEQRYPRTSRNKGPTSFLGYKEPGALPGSTFFESISFHKIALRVTVNQVPATKYEESDSANFARLANISYGEDF